MAITPLAIRMMSVGQICIQWAHIEYLFAHVIWALLRLDQETGKITTGGLDMLPRANMAINLATHLGAPQNLIQALKSARKAIQGGLDARRNAAVHGVSFTEGKEPYEIHVEVHRGSGDRKKKHLPNSELSALAEELGLVIENLGRVVRETGILHQHYGKPARLIDLKMTSRRSGSEDQPGSKSP